MNAFTVIKGGLQSRHHNRRERIAIENRDGGSGGGGTSGGGGRKRKRRHWLEDALWYAIVTKPRPTNTDTIHRRVCEFLGKPLKDIAQSQVIHAMMVVRDNPKLYEWGIAHVGKGLDDKRRRYFPVLMDYKNPAPDGSLYTVWDADDEPFARHGMISSLSTIRSMCRHQHSAFDMMIPMIPADERNKWRKMRDSIAIVEREIDESLIRAYQL